MLRPYDWMARLQELQVRALCHTALRQPDKISSLKKRKQLNIKASHGSCLRAEGEAGERSETNEGIA